MSEPTAYLVTVVYADQNGATRHIGAVVVAVDAADAIDAAVYAVQALPECAKVIGGCLEPFGPEVLGAPEPLPNARNAGQTVH